MAVAAADFYTYARATGTPLPKSKQEEAKLAPAVDKWKKSRLSNTRQEEKGIDAGQVAGLTAIGAAALAAFNPGARRNLLNFVDKIPPNTETVIRDQSGQLVRGRPKPGTAVSTDLGGIKQDLNKLREETAKRSWEDQKAKQTFVVEKVPETTVVEKIDSNLATTPVRKEAEAKQALDAYRDKWIAEHSTSKQNIAAIQQGIKESGGLRKEVRPDLSNLTEDQQKYLDFKIEEQASYDPKLEAQLQSQTIEQTQQVSTPRDYIESTGAIEAKSNQVTAVDASKLDDVAVSQQVIENTNLNLQDELHQAPQVGIDPEVSEVASSRISAQSGAVPVEKVGGNQQIVYTTPTRTEGFYTRPQNLSSEAKQGALSQFNVDNTGSQYPTGGTFLREYTTLGSKIAGDTNIQRGTVPPGQLELPIVYSTRGRTNPTLRTQLVNESPTYTSVDEYLARYEPVPTENVQLGPSSAFLTDEQLDLETKRLRAISDLGQREEELIKSGLRPVTKGGQPTIRFDNARAAGWTSKQYTPISITNRQFQETASMPKSLREVLGEPPGRVFYETTSEGQIIPETVERRGERPQILMEPKGGGGRKRAESVAPPDNPLDTLIVQKQVMPTGAQTRPVQDAIERDVLTETGGLELSPPIYANTDQTGRVIDAYGIQTGNYPKADLGMRPTEMPISPTTGKEKQSFGTRPSVSPEIATESVRQSEIIKRLSDPNWLTSAGVDLNKTTPQEQVALYLKSQGIPQRTSTPLVIRDENVDLRGTPVKFKAEVEPSVTQTKFAQPLNYPAAQNQVTYVPPTESTIRSLPVTPSELEKAERMHLLNYISAAHGQIKGGARAGGTKMRNNLTPYQTPSDAMLNQLVMKRRMERI